MPVYNGRPYLQEAIRSILNQTFGDFEFVIINDGSRDGSKEVLEEFADQDHRIQVLHQTNQGITPSLNRGLKLARGRYIARMDADDISHPERFDRQIEFLESNPRVGILGTQIRRVDADGNPRGQWTLPTDPDLIGWQLLFSTCLCHPTVMMRHSLLDNLNGYAEWASGAGDYELWTRAMLESQLANLSNPLHKLRRHEDSITATKREKQHRVSRRAAATLHEALLGEWAEEELSHFLSWMHHENVQRAVAETGIQGLTAVHDYIRTLYRVYVRDVLSGNRNVEVRRAALPKLDAVADQMAKNHSQAAGFLQKVRARLMHPTSEIVPWAVKAASERASIF
jgi:glycosyltransferase involved in cell wall biosynthesis